MWTKGAVMVIKSGDEHLANALETGTQMTKMMVPLSKFQELQRKYDFLKQKELDRQKEDILEARRKYAIKKRIKLPSWCKPITDAWIFVVYLFSTLLDKVIP